MCLNHKMFYKRECQEKYSPAELEAGENRPGIQLPSIDRWRRLSFVVLPIPKAPVCLGQVLAGSPGFTPCLFLLSGCVRQNGPVKGAPTGTA